MAFLLSCEKQKKWDLETSSSRELVVDGIITNEEIVQQVKLCYSITDPNEEPEKVRGAEVIVTVGENVYQFHEDAQHLGTYISDVAFKGLPGKEHSLFISDNNNIYTAKAGMAQTNGNFPIARYNRNSENQLYHIVWACNPYNPVRPAIYEIELDWAGINEYEDVPASETHARLLYYALPTLDVSEVLSPTAEIVYFPAGTRITEKRYSITADHAEFLRAMLSETSWQGGYFSSASSNVPTNLSSGACGYFGASAVTYRTDVVKAAVPLD